MGTIPLKPIPEDQQGKRGWSVYINGELVEDVSELRIVNERYGEVYYGSAGAYDSWCFMEIGGGGSVTVAYFVYQNRLYVGMVEQNRANQGGFVKNVTRGFLDPGEKHMETAIREFTEEMGYVDPNERMGEFESEPANPNSTFFVTNDEGEGVHFFPFEVYMSEVELDIDAEVECPRGLVWKFRDDVLHPVDKVAELILGSRFYPVEYAVQQADMFTKAVIGELLVHLMRQGKTIII